MTEVRYHAALFAFLGERPDRSESAIAAVQAWEAQHGLKLPAAVREWYELDGPALWRKYMPRDYVPELAENPPLRWLKVKSPSNDRHEYPYFIVLAEPSDSSWGEIVEPVHPGQFLVLSEETDCGISTIVRIDDAADPTLGLDGESHGPDTKIYGPFSTWVFDSFLDDASHNIDASYNRQFPNIVTATAELPSEDDLRELRAAFRSGPVGVGGVLGWAYRFYSDGNFILIGKSPFYDDPCGTTWEIRSRSAADLCHALATLWPLANLRQTLVLQQGDENLHRILEDASDLAGSRDEIASHWRRMAVSFIKDTY
jgi:hypothetical protein